jgi:hypothetical protein
MALQPDERYASAAGFARDVKAWLEGQPVSAQPPSLNYLIAQYVRRNRWPVAVAVSILTGILATAAIGTYLAIKARKAEAHALVEKDGALAAEQRAAEAMERANHRGYQAAVELATMHLEQAEPYLAAEKLRATPPRFRGWEWGYLMTAVPPPESIAESELAAPGIAAATPDGAVAAVAEENRLHVIDLRSGRIIVRKTYAGPIGRIALSLDGSIMAVVETSPEQEVLHVSRVDGGGAWSKELCGTADIAWEPPTTGGALLVVCGNSPTPSPGQLLRFHPATGDVLNERSIERFKTVDHSLVVGAAGRMAVVGNSYKDLEIISLPDLRTLSVDQEPSGEAARALLLDDTRDLLVVGRGRRVYAGPASRSASRLVGEVVDVEGAKATHIRHMNWLADGRWVARGDQSMLVQDESTVRIAASAATALAPLSGGRLLALLQSGRVVVRPELPARADAGLVTLVGGDDAEGRGTVFTPDSREAVFQSWRRDGLQRVPLSDENRSGAASSWTRFERQPAAEWSVLPTVHPDGSILTTVGGRLAVLRKNGTTPEQVSIPGTDQVWSASASPDGSRVAVAIPSGVRLLDWKTHEIVRDWNLPGGPFHVSWLARGDASRPVALVAISRDSTLHYLPMAGAPTSHQLPFRVNGYYPAPLAVHPRQPLLAGALAAPGYAVYDLGSLPAPPRLVARGAMVPSVTALAFTPDATRLAVATTDHRLELWDWAHELRLIDFPLNSTCASIAFSPDGQWMANTDYAPSLVLRRAALPAAPKSSAEK